MMDDEDQLGRNRLAEELIEEIGGISIDGRVSRRKKRDRSDPHDS